MHLQIKITKGQILPVSQLILPSASALFKNSSQKLQDQPI